MIADNLLDFSHLSYVHEKTLGGSTSIAETRPSIERLERGVKIVRDVRNTVPAPYQQRLARFDGPVDRRFLYDFTAPGILLMLSYVKPSSTPDHDMTGALRMHTCQALTPETEHSTHYFFSAAHDYRLEDGTVTESIYQSVIAAFEEDRRIITAQARLIERSVPAPMQAINADAALGQFRFIVKKLIEQEAQAT